MRNMKFRAEDDGASASAGAAAFDEPAAPPVVEPPVTPPASDAPAPTVDAAELAKQFADNIGKVMADNRPAPQETPLTPEEAKKLLRVWEPDDAWFARFDNLETRKQAVLEMRDSLVAQADTVGQYRLRDHGDALRGEFKPALEFITKAEQRERDSDFKEAYPELAKPELKPLVTAVRDQFTKEKRSFNSEADYHRAVGDAVVATIKVVNPKFELTAVKPRPAGGIPVTTPGAGGGGGGSAATQPKSLGHAVFAK